MKLFIPLQLCISLLFCTMAAAQHQHQEKILQQKEPLTFEKITTLVLEDPDLKGYTLETSMLTISPGARDTVSHRHDCEVFGYVLEGKVEIGLEHKSPVKYETGQFFYEKRNVLHSLAANPSEDKSSRVLLLFLIKDGRSGYTEEYPASPVKK